MPEHKMEQVNYLALLFSFLTLYIILMGGLMNTFEKYLPIFLRQTFRYGKFAYKGTHSYLKPLAVPKSWFKHFYVYAAMLASFALIVMIFTIVFGFSLPHDVYDFLDSVGGSPRQGRVSNASALLAMFLFTMQSLRRFYDTHYVSVFSKRGLMDVSYYLIGFIHYTGSVLAILVETPRFTKSKQSKLHWQDVTYLHIAAALLFLWAWVRQYKATVILGNLRKDAKGSVVSQAHKLPQGDWFKYVSCPHLLSEILMYFALTIILWNNMTWFCVFTWVLSNQVETALLSHWWYQETFKDLPKDRKALIPFIL